MSDYVFKDEFLNNLPSEIDEPVNAQSSGESIDYAEKMPRGEGCLRLVFIQTVVCIVIVLSCLLLRSAAPKAYLAIKSGYTAAVTQKDISFDDIKMLFSKPFHNLDIQTLWVG